MTAGLRILGLLAIAAALAACRARFRLSAPVVLVVAGLAMSFVPHIPEYRLDPDIVLALFLPPLLYSAAIDSSLIGFRENVRSIGFLSVGLVLATTVAVGDGRAPHRPRNAAGGRVRARGDRRAPGRGCRQRDRPRTGVARRLLRILGGESLVNDATALIAYLASPPPRVAGSASSVGSGYSWSPPSAASASAWVAGGRLAAVRARLTEPVLENSLTLLTPFAAYFLAESSVPRASWRSSCRPLPRRITRPGHLRHPPPVPRGVANGRLRARIGRLPADRRPAPRSSTGCGRSGASPGTPPSSC